MSRGSRMEGLDALLGTSSQRGDMVRIATGVHTNRDIDFPVQPDGDPCSAYRHGKLRGQRRCFGCGRTRNEIEIEGG